MFSRLAALPCIALAVVAEPARRQWPDPASFDVSEDLSALFSRTVDVTFKMVDDDQNGELDKTEQQALIAQWSEILDPVRGSPLDLNFATIFGSTTLNKHAVDYTTLRWLVDAMPKVELHVHGDGALDEQGLWEVAHRRGLPLPSNVTTVEELAPYMTCPPKACPTLTDFIAKFNFFLPYIAGSKQGLTLLGERFVFTRQAPENVRYSEVRFAPQLVTAGDGPGKLTTEEVVRAVAAGVQKGAKLSSMRGSRTESRLILCCMRHQDAAECERIVRLAAQLKAEGVPVVGVDLAGDEIKFPNEPFIPAFKLAKQLGLGTTVHSGEAGPHGPRDCETAIEEMQVDRIGHGYLCLKSEKAVALLKSQHGPHLEACPISSVGTGSEKALNPNHPIAHYGRMGLNFGINTDDPAVLVSTMGKEFEVAATRLQLSLNKLRLASVMAARSTFLPDAEREQLTQLVVAWWQRAVGVMQGLQPKPTEVHV